jgi:propanediol dehydratase large subunit
MSPTRALQHATQGPLAHLGNGSLPFACAAAAAAAAAAGMDEQGTISQASVEAAIQQMSGGGNSGPQHVTVIDAFKVCPRW